MGAIGVLNTSVASTNLGDYIIMDACRPEIEAARPDDHLIDFSSHDTMTYHSLKVQRRRVRWNVLCGTNCLSSNMLIGGGWSVNLATAQLMRPVTTLGVGWGGYQSKPGLYTRNLLQKLLGRAGLLSVRDEYTRHKFIECGLNNVVNTGCPTIWGLDKKHCASIPLERAQEVVYTLTDYAPDYVRDTEALCHLVASYQRVHIWMQGAADLKYYKSLLPGLAKRVDTRCIVIVPPRLAAYDSILSGDVEYIGTRLHGGIRALQKGRRTLILGVDNRAIEMGKDFGLPVIRREDHDDLPSKISASRKTDISIPVGNISSYREFLSGWNA